MTELELNKEYTYPQICETVGWKQTTGDSRMAQIREIEDANEYYHPINKKTHKPKSRIYLQRNYVILWSHQEKIVQETTEKIFNL